MFAGLCKKKKAYLTLETSSKITMFHCTCEALETVQYPAITYIVTVNALSVDLCIGQITSLQMLDTKDLSNVNSRGGKCLTDSELIGNSTFHNSQFINVDEISVHLLLDYQRTNVWNGERRVQQHYRGTRDAT